MKKIIILALTLVLTAALFAGCGCTNTGAGNASTPTGMTETMPTIATTEPTTRPTTRPTQPSSVPTTEATEESGMGSDPTATTGENTIPRENTGTGGGTVEGRARGIVPHGGR